MHFMGDHWPPVSAIALEWLGGCSRLRSGCRDAAGRGAKMPLVEMETGKIDRHEEEARLAALAVARDSRYSARTRLRRHYAAGR